MHLGQSSGLRDNRKSALPDAKRDPEMGQLNSPWPTYGGVGQLHCGSIWYRLAATHRSGHA